MIILYSTEIYGTYCAFVYCNYREFHCMREKLIRRLNDYAFRHIEPPYATLDTQYLAYY